MIFFSSFYEKLYKIRFVFPLLFVIGSLVGFFAIYQQSLSLIIVGLIIAAISEILMAVFLIMSLILLRFRVVIAFALAMIASGIVFVYALQYLKEKNAGKETNEKPEKMVKILSKWSTQSPMILMRQIPTTIAFLLRVFMTKLTTMANLSRCQMLRRNQL